MDVYSDARQLALTRVTSDHCLVLSDANIVKWGPAPFRFENMWLEHPLRRVLRIGGMRKDAKAEKVLNS